MTLQRQLKEAILDVPDFPAPGIVFKDITPVLSTPSLLRAVTDAFAERVRGQGITQIVGVESRGFLFGAPLALATGLGLTLVRKPGKLPRAVRTVEYALEYGTDSLQIHADALGPEDRVLIVDDVLATGGTAAATAQLVESTGARVDGLAFLMELSFLDGRSKLGAHSVYSILTY
jgi:adenine phosphoribosyltransferase